MLNLFLSYKCNLSCDYCFASGLDAEFPAALSWEDFLKLSAWLEKNAVLSLAILGGEPTLHPQIVEIVTHLKNKGIMLALFTNGLFPERLRKELADNVTNFVINFNDPSMFRESQWQLLNSNIKYLREQGCRVAFSKNFAKQFTDYEYIIKACKEYGIKHIRYDITRPAPHKHNGYFELQETKAILKTVVDFVRECSTENIKTGLDCCIPLCYLDDADREFLKKESVKFSGICHPSVDIHPDLSASYCLPMRKVTAEDVTKFSGERGLFEYFSNAVRALRYSNPTPACMECPDFKTRCQGGCLALKGD